MSENILYNVNQANVSELAAHLLTVDATFDPALSSRVEILAYSQKLRDQAVRFEAWLGKQLVGLVAIYCNNPTGGKSFVTNVSVLSEYHKQGIAAHLMRQCIDYARELGFGQLELEVSMDNMAAIGLYRNLGFNKICSNSSTQTMGVTLLTRAI